VKKLGPDDGRLESKQHSIALLTVGTSKISHFLHPPSWRVGDGRILSMNFLVFVQILG
jgi:hypothetical protein